MKAMVVYQVQSHCSIALARAAPRIGLVYGLTESSVKLRKEAAQAYFDSFFAAMTELEIILNERGRLRAPNPDLEKRVDKKVKDYLKSITLLFDRDAPFSSAEATALIKELDDFRPLIRQACDEITTKLSGPVLP